MISILYDDHVSRQSKSQNSLYRLARQHQKLLLWELPETLVRLLDAVGVSEVAKKSQFFSELKPRAKWVFPRGRYTVYVNGFQRQGNFYLQNGPISP